MEIRSRPKAWIMEPSSLATFIRRALYRLTKISYLSHKTDFCPSGPPLAPLFAVAADRNAHKNSSQSTDVSHRPASGDQPRNHSPHQRIGDQAKPKNAAIRGSFP